MNRKTFKEALLDAWDAIIPLVGLNLIWFLMTVLIITAFPAYGALQYSANQIAHGRSAGFRTFFEGFRKHFWTSWKWGLITSVVYALMFLNVWFYGQFEGVGYLILQSLFLSSILIFSCMQIYTYPFLLEQDEPSIKVAVRNSFAAFIKFMGRTFVILIFFLAISIVSVFLPPLWILLTMAVIVYFANWQTLVVIFELREPAQIKPEDSNSEL
jgi:uncharacterized membrane protein YesL